MVPFDPMLSWLQWFCKGATHTGFNWPEPLPGMMVPPPHYPAGLYSHYDKQSAPGGVLLHHHDATFYIEKKARLLLSYVGRSLSFT